MKGVNSTPAGVIPTGVDVAWVFENAEEIAKVALTSINCKWEKQSAVNQKAWVDNIRLFGDAILTIAASQSKPITEGAVPEK